MTTQHELAWDQAQNYTKEDGMPHSWHEIAVKKRVQIRELKHIEKTKVKDRAKCQ